MYKVEANIRGNYKESLKLKLKNKDKDKD